MFPFLVRLFFVDPFNLLDRSVSCLLLLFRASVYDVLHCMLLLFASPFPLYAVARGLEIFWAYRFWRGRTPHHDPRTRRFPSLSLFVSLLLFSLIASSASNHHTTPSFFSHCGKALTILELLPWRPACAPFVGDRRRAPLFCCASRV